MSAKKNYFKPSVEHNMSDSKSLWKSLKSLVLPNKASQGSSYIGLNINGEVCFDKIKVADQFNSF